MIPPKTSSFLSLTFLVPEYTGELPVFDPGDVVDLEEDTEQPKSDGNLNMKSVQSPYKKEAT